MNQDEKVMATAERDRCWADLRENAERIQELLSGKDNLETLDMLLFYQCVVIVLTEFMIEDFSDEGRNKDEDMLRILIEVGYRGDMINEKLPNEKRLKAAQKLRKSIWVNMFTKRDRIAKLQAAYPNLEKDEMPLMMQCVAIVGIELEIREKEIDLLYS